MKLDKSKNTKRNIIYGIINKTVTLLLPFLIRSIIIYFLSAEYLGINSLFSSIIQVLNLTELGFSSAIVYSMYKPVAENDEETICALLNFYRKAYFIIGCVVLVIGLSLLPFLDKLINGDYPSGLNIRIIYLFYLINTVLSYMLFAYKNSILNAYQRTDILSNVNTITLSGMYLVQIVILTITKNFYLFVVMMPFFTLLNNIIIAVISKRMYPQYVCKGKVSKDLLSGMKKQVSGLMVTKLCAVTRNSFDSIFVSAFLGLTTTAMYGNYYYIMNAIIGVLMVVSNSMLAGVGNSIVTDSVEKNYKDLQKINFIYMWIAGWCTICLLCLYQPFMKIWVGEELMFSIPVMISFCIYFYALEMGVVRGVYSDAAGLWWENRYRAIAEAIANIILNYCLVQFMDVMGIIIATLISLLIINFGLGSQIVFKYYFKNKKLHEYFLCHVKYFLVTAFISIITYLIIGTVTVDGILGLLIKAFICVILPNILYILIYRRNDMYKSSVSWILSVFHLNKLCKLFGVDNS